MSLLLMLIVSVLPVLQLLFKIECNHYYLDDFLNTGFHNWSSAVYFESLNGVEAIKHFLTYANLPMQFEVKFVSFTSVG